MKAKDLHWPEVIQWKQFNKGQTTLHREMRDVTQFSESSAALCCMSQGGELKDKSVFPEVKNESSKSGTGDTLMSWSCLSDTLHFICICCACAWPEAGNIAYSLQSKNSSTHLSTSCFIHACISMEGAGRRSAVTKWWSGVRCVKWPFGSVPLLTAPPPLL